MTNFLIKYLKFYPEFMNNLFLECKSSKLNLMCVIRSWDIERYRYY